MASLYYQLNISQSDIAARLDVSSSTVSRLLKEARKGSSRFEFECTSRDFELEQQLIEHFGLKDAYILKTSPSKPTRACSAPLGVSQPRLHRACHRGSAAGIVHWRRVGDEASTRR